MWVQARQFYAASITEFREQIHRVSFEQVPDLILVVIPVMISRKDGVSDLASFTHDRLRRVEAHLADFAIQGRELSGIRVVFLQSVCVAARAPLNELTVEELP